MEMTMYNHYIKRFYHWKHESERKGTKGKVRHSYANYAIAYGRDAIKLAEEIGLEENLNLKGDLEILIEKVRGGR